MGCLFGGLTMELWGRRRMNFIGNIGMVIGWLLIVFAQNPAMIIYGRITEGFTRSLLATTLTVIIQAFFNNTILKPLAFTTTSIAMTHTLNFV
jgi:MFS family permease